MESGLDSGELLERVYHLSINKYYVLGYTAMLLYDHILTLDNEIALIWQQRFTLPTYLFFAFRYTTAIVCILNLIAEHDPNWTGMRCSRWIWVPAAVGPIISATTGIILILRVHALYNRALWILYLTVPMYLAQVAVMVWSIPAAVVAQFPPGIVGCIPTEASGTINRLTGSYAASVIFDASIFLLTLARAVHLRLRGSRIPLVALILRDGVMYFLALMFVNLLNVYILIRIPEDLSTMNARFSNLITATLVARLMLNLRAASRCTLHTSSSSYSARHITTLGDVGSWLVSSGTLSDVFGMSDFDVPIGGYHDEGYDGTTTVGTGTGSSRTAIAQADAWERGRELDIELRTLGPGRANHGLLPRDEG